MGSGVSRKIITTKERFFIVFPETMYAMLGNLRVEATYLFYVPSVGLPRLDHDVIHVGLDGSPDVLAKDLGHAPLVCGPCVSEAERQSRSSTCRMG